MAALPENTDSFIVLSRLDEWLLPLLLQAGAPAEAMAYAGMLESVAVGISAAGTEDLRRLSTIGTRIRGAEAVAHLQAACAADVVAPMQRRMVGQQRILNQETIHHILAATENFHLSPMYIVLSGKPGSEMLMHQLSSLPFMVPLEPNGALELVLKDSWRGFVLHANRLPWAELELPPAEEEQLKSNLRDARIYLLLKAMGTKLVLALCSRPEQLQTPAAAASSVLAGPTVARLDAYADDPVYLAARSSAAMVNLQRDSFMGGCRMLAAYAEGVFRGMAADNPSGKNSAKAAEAVVQLRNMLEQILAPVKHPEWMLIRRRGNTVHLECETDAQGLSLEVSPLPCWGAYTAPDTLVYAGMPHATCAAIPALEDILAPAGNVAEGLAEHLQSPEKAAELRSRWTQMKESLVFLKTIYEASGKSGTLVWARVGEHAPETLVIPLADRGAFEEGVRSLLTLHRVPYRTQSSQEDGSSVYFWNEETEPLYLTVENTAAALGNDASFNKCRLPLSPAPPVPGAVFRLNTKPLVELIVRDMSPADAAPFHRLENLVECVEGAYSVHGDKALLRIDCHLHP